MDGQADILPVSKDLIKEPQENVYANGNLPLFMSHGMTWRCVDKEAFKVCWNIMVAFS
jgi:hypothetical protein